MLVVRLARSPAEVRWLRLGAEGVVAEGEGLPQAAGESVLALAPAEGLVELVARVPTRSPRTMQQAIPFALEDQLIDEVEALHFVAGERLGEQAVAVTVVAHALLQRWLDWLAEARLRVTRLVPETALMPAGDGTGWRLWLSAQVAWLRAGEDPPLVTEPANLPLLFEAAAVAAAADGPRSLEITRFAPPGDDPAAAPPAAGEGDGAAADPMAALALDPAAWQVREQQHPQDLLPHLAQRLCELPRPPDLLTGRYSRREAAGRLWRPWWPVLGLMLLWAGVHVADLTLQVQRLQDRQAGLEAEIARQFARALPGARPVDPRRQLGSALAARQRSDGGGAAELAGVLDLVAGALPAAAGERADAGSALQSLRYRRGQLELDLRVPSLQRLDQVRDGLSRDPAWSVEVRSANSGDGGVDARLSLQREGT